MCHGAEVDQGRQCAQLDPVARAQLEASFTQYVFNTTKTRSKLGEVCVSKRAQVVADVRTKGIQETDGALLSYKAKCRYSDQSRTWSCNYLTTEREVRRRNNSAAVIRGDVDYAKAISIVRFLDGVTEDHPLTLNSCAMPSMIREIHANDLAGRIVIGEILDDIFAQLSSRVRISFGAMHESLEVSADAMCWDILSAD